MDFHAAKRRAKQTGGLPVGIFFGVDGHGPVVSLYDLSVPPGRGTHTQNQPGTGRQIDVSAKRPGSFERQAAQCGPCGDLHDPCGTAGHHARAGRGTAWGTGRRAGLGLAG